MSSQAENSAPSKDAAGRAVLVGLHAADETRVAGELRDAGVGIALTSAAGLDDLRTALALRPELVVTGDRPGAPAASAVAAELRAARSDAALIALVEYRQGIARRLMTEGATEVVYRDRFDRLPLAFARELGDVHDRRRLREAEEAVRRSEAAVHRVLQALPDAIGVHRDGRFVLVNTSQAALCGYSDPQSMIGVEVNARMPAADAAVAADRAARLQRGEQVPLREYSWHRPDGTRVVIEVSSIPFQHDGQAAVLSVARDVTERKATQGRLVQADRMAAVGKLAAGVAHEINNPLAFVIANLGVVQADLRTVVEQLRALHDLVPEEGRARLGDALQRLAGMTEALFEASEGSERVRAIVRDLKTFSRNDDTGGGPVDLRKVIESSLNMAWNEIRQRARLVKDLKPVPLIDANESRLALLFLNLVVNAAQAIPEGDREANEIRVSSAVDEQGRAVVLVEDTGVGIAAEVLPRIFDPFFTTRAIGSGVGLGLSVSHAIVTQLGGEIAAGPRAGRGSWFRVTLPAGGQPAVVRQETGTQAPATA